VLVGNIENTLELGQLILAEIGKVRLAERPHEEIQLAESTPAGAKGELAAAGFGVRHPISIDGSCIRWKASPGLLIIHPLRRGDRRMTSFEFFTVLLSFMVSLGVANLLQTIVRLIQENQRVHFSLTYALWVVAIFNLQVTFWFKAWSYREGFALRTETSIPPLVLAIIAFIACGLATVRVPETGPIDLRGFHAKQGRKYQIAYAAFMLVAIVQAALMGDAQRDFTTFIFNSLVQTGLALICILAAIFHRRRWVQIWAPAVLLVSAIIFYGRLMEQ
jgi:hypothetical protein